MHVSLIDPFQRVRHFSGSVPFLLVVGLLPLAVRRMLARAGPRVTVVRGRHDITQIILLSKRTKANKMCERVLVIKLPDEKIFENFYSQREERKRDRPLNF